MREFKHRIYYYETDQMGVVYHSNYLKWLEIARTEYLRDTISYKSLEEMGIVMPVKSLNIEYINSVKYDDMISIQIEIKELTSVKVIFEYTIFDQEGVLKAKANTTNVFTNKNGKIEKVTNEILEKLKNNKKEEKMMKKSRTLKLVIISILTLNLYQLKAETTIDLGETVIPREKIDRDDNLEKKADSSNKNYTQKITEKEIKESASNNIIELLQKMTSVDVKNGYTGTGVVDIRGYGETALNNTKIIVDGITMNPIDGSGVDINSIPLENIKLIEVISGGSGVLFGDGSTGGTVIITTKDLVKNDLYKIESYIATNNTFNEKLDINKVVSENTTINFGVEKKDSDGYRINSGLDELNVYSGITQKFGEDLVIKGKYNYLDSKRGLPGSVSELNMEKYGRTYGDDNDKFSREKNNFLLDFLYSKENYNIQSTLNYQTRETVGEYIDPYFSYVRSDKEKSYNVNTKATYNYNSSSNIIVGLDIENGKIKTETSYGNSKNEKTSLGTYLLNTNNYKNFIFKEGIRIQKTKYSEVSDVRYTNEAYELSGEYKYSDTGKIYAGYNKSFRTPNIDEINPLYGLGDKFKVQENSEFEFGISDYYKKNIIDLNAFYVETKNEIYYDPNGNYGWGNNGNIDGKTVRYGIEARIEQKYSKLNLRESVTLLNSKINDGIYKNSKIPGTSNAIFNLGAEFYPVDKLKMSANYSYRGSQYAISDFYNKKDKQKGYSVVNVDLKYNVNTNFIVQFGINNLFNEKYNDYTVYSSLSNKLASYPADERTYYIKFDYILEGGNRIE